MTPTVTGVVVELARHALQQWREWADGQLLDYVDRATIRRVMERQNAIMALLISELELEKGSDSHE